MPDNMSQTLPVIYLARDSETAWSLTGQNTGLADLPLTEHRVNEARTSLRAIGGLTCGQCIYKPVATGCPGGESPDASQRVILFWNDTHHLIENSTSIKAYESDSFIA